MVIGSCMQTIEPSCPESGFSVPIRPKSAKAGRADRRDTVRVRLTQSLETSMR